MAAKPRTEGPPGYANLIYARIPSVTPKNSITIRFNGFAHHFGGLLVPPHSRLLCWLRLGNENVEFADPIDIWRFSRGRRNLVENLQDQLVLWIDGSTIVVVSAVPRVDPLTAGAIAAPASPAQVFAQRCCGCNAVGTSNTSRSTESAIRGIVDHEIASYGNFADFKAMKSVKGRWTRADPRSVPTNSQAFAPSTMMTFGAVTDGAEWEAIIAFLESLL